MYLASDAFTPGSFDAMSSGANAQILLDHLLALSMNGQPAPARTGAFVLLYPAQNTAVDAVATSYAANVVDESSVATTLESVVAALQTEFAERWGEECRRRYLDTDQIENER